MSVIIEGLFIEIAGLLALGQRQIQILFLAITHHADVDGAAVARTDRAGEVAGVVYRLIINLNDDVACMKASFVGPAAFFDGTHEHAVAVLYAEKFSELRSRYFPPSARCAPIA